MAADPATRECRDVLDSDIGTREYRDVSPLRSERLHRVWSEGRRHRRQVDHEGLLAVWAALHRHGVTVLLSDEPKWLRTTTQTATTTKTTRTTTTIIRNRIIQNNNPNNNTNNNNTLPQHQQQQKQTTTKPLKRATTIRARLRRQPLKEHAYDDD